MDFLSNLPMELAEHLSDFPGIGNEQTDVRLLDEQTALNLSAKLTNRCEFASNLGLVILDDSNTSDHHCYISKGPAEGMIMSLLHDGEPEIAFDSLSKYLKEMRRLIREEEFIDEIVTDVQIEETKQDSIEAFVLENISQISPEELYAYISLIRTSNIRLIQSLASHEDFVVREFTARQLARSPNLDALNIAEALSVDESGQVANAGMRAVDAIKRLSNG